MHAYLRELTSYFAIEVPNLCPDLTAWVTSGFKTVSPSTTRFMAQLQRFRRSESATRASPGDSGRRSIPKRHARRKHFSSESKGSKPARPGSSIPDSKRLSRRSHGYLVRRALGHVSLVVPRVQSR